MNKTEERILKEALKLYNNNGIENITVRHIAKEMDILHSNITYYYPKKDDIIKVLYLELQTKFDKLIDKYSHTNYESFFEIFVKNFEITYKYRFGLINNAEIFKRVPELKAIYVKKKKERVAKFNKLSEILTKNKLLKKLNTEELNLLITNVFLVSDFWIVYNELNPGKKLKEQKRTYLKLMFNIFYTHLTDKGRELFTKNIPA